MRWDEIQERFPNEWVVLEATKAYSKAGQRYIEEMAVIDSYADSKEALKRYSELHREDPHREYCFFSHFPSYGCGSRTLRGSSRAKMNITEYYGLPFISMTIIFRGKELTLEVKN
ncbi:hypothetical protein [Paenibacillus sp. DYY-L-2]|uniref:hypothetical protein n=1 Tax=Paenibacillus sp. DYY-L-2 TaxID=3447013 RepID=UPI003F5014A3